MPERLDDRQRCVVRVRVEMHAPYKGRVYDTCCGSAGMFVPSEKFIEKPGWRIDNIEASVRSHFPPISHRLLRRSDCSHDAL